MKFILAIFLMSSLTSTFACDSHGTTGFLPENDLKIYANQKGTSGITEAQFNKIIDRVEKIYSPIVKAKGATLKTFRGWTDPTVNAYAEQSTPGVYGVHMFGGLARHETVTADGFALVMCHELGHHLGGAPKIGDRDNMSNDWATNEGQADYWGTMKCLRQYVAMDSNNIEIAANYKPSQFVINSCTSAHSTKEEVAICIRTSMAGKSLAELFRALRHSPIPVEFTTPDKNVVKSTNDSHPASQCRLDTYFQGSLCARSALEEVSDTDYRIGVCAAESDKVGKRPRCWFAPESTEIVTPTKTPSKVRYY